jgi:hypothetical protein
MLVVAALFCVFYLAMAMLAHTLSDQFKQLLAWPLCEVFHGFLELNDTNYVRSAPGCANIRRTS